MSRKIYLFSLSKHHDAINIPSLEVEFFKPKIEFSSYDYLIVTSKQAVNALLEHESKNYLSKKALCISQASAKAFKAIGGDILDVADGYGDGLLEYIQKYPKTTKWLYLRASVIASDFAKKAYDEGYNIDEVVVYKTKCSKEILEVDVPKDAILIFTSPSSVECYLKRHIIHKQNGVVVIGKTTAKALPENIKYIVSAHTKIQSCIDAALSHH